MAAEIIPFKKPLHPLTQAQQHLCEALKLVRDGGHQPMAVDLLLSRAHELVYDYVEIAGKR